MNESMTKISANANSNIEHQSEHLELLLFSLGIDLKTQRNELFGINVLKIREIIPVPEITQAPDMPEHVVGFVSIRNELIPVMDLQAICGIQTDARPSNMIITEYSNHVHGFLVNRVERIHRASWQDIKEPPLMITKRMGGLISAVSELPDARLMMVLDVETILNEIAAIEDEAQYDMVKPVSHSLDKKVFFVDDSSAARKQIAKTLDKLGIEYIASENGKLAWQKLDNLANELQESDQTVSDMIGLVLTDIEMPELDGYKLTKKLKSDDRFSNIPVLLHSSLTSQTNVVIGMDTGADDYVGKFEPQELAKVISKHLA